MTQEERTGRNRRLDLVGAVVNLGHMKEQYDWAVGRMEDALTRFAEYIPSLESQGSIFSTALREIQSQKANMGNGTRHSLSDNWDAGQINEFDKLLTVIGYGSRGINGFFYTPNHAEDRIVDVVKAGYIYTRGGDLYVTPSRCFILPKLFGVKNPFEKLATDLEQRIHYVVQGINEFQKT